MSDNFLVMKINEFISAWPIGPAERQVLSAAAETIETQERELHFRRNLFTIEEAADLVGLRPVTIAKLLGEGELAYTFVDGKQHVGGTSLWEYSERRKAERQKAFEELRAIDEELGLGDG
jgi:excisionase family DNA binding protein